VTFSEQFNNAAWSKGFVNSTVTVTANQSIAPDGTMSADKVELGAVPNVTNYAVISQSFTATAGAYSSSFYFKGQNGGETIYISYTKDGVNYTRQLCTLTTAWQRFTLTSTLTSGADNVQFGIDRRDGSQGATPAQTFYVWGGQLEAGAYATSYIPTLGTSVTRVADAASKTGISSLIGQTEGTVFVEFPFNSKQGMAFQIATSNGYENAIYLERITDSFMAVQCWVGGVQQVSILLSGMVEGQVYKVAVAYKANDFAVYKDGTLVNTDTSASLPASINNLYVGNFGGAAGYELPINQLLLFKTRLSNSDLAALTA
jgi:hypothetical protein